MWTPTHVVVTVTRAKNLLDKGKGGNDAYCIIGLGKEKFLTSVKPKTVNPVWEEQAEFALTEREELKVTIYHKSSLIDEYVGRAVVNISDLAAESINTHSQWYKLMGKPDKEHKKPEKARGEVEIRIDFLVKPKSGSMADLSKTKDKSLSLKSLKDKGSNFKGSITNIKHSIGDKFKSLQRSGSKKKYSGENQLSDQSKKLGGSKLDFLDGDDYSSLASSYSSLNGPALVREIKQNRYSPRSSIINSETSSVNANNNPFEDHLDDSVSSASATQAKNTSQTKKSSAPPPPPSASSPRQSKEVGVDVLPPKPETVQQPRIQPQPPQDIQPSTSTPQTRMRSILKKNEDAAAKQVAPSPPSHPEVERTPSEDNFASVFQNAFDDKNLPKRVFEKKNAKNSTPPASVSTKPAAPKLEPQPARQMPTKPDVNKKADTSFSGSTNGNKSFTYEDDIDWASSDEEIVKQQIATFERNQVPRNNSIRGSKRENKTNKSQTPPPLPPLPQKPTVTSSNNVTRSTPLPEVPKQTLVQVPAASKELESQLEKAFKSPVEFFQTDIDPFSSSSSSSSKQTSRTPSFTINNKSAQLRQAATKMSNEQESMSFDDIETQQLDFDKIDELLNTSKPFSDPFSGLNLKSTGYDNETTIVQQQQQQQADKLGSLSSSSSSISRSSPNVSPILKRTIDTRASPPSVQIDQANSQSPILNNRIESNDDDDDDDDDDDNGQTTSANQPEDILESKIQLEEQKVPQELKIPTIEILDQMANHVDNYSNDAESNDSDPGTVHDTLMTTSLHSDGPGLTDIGHAALNPFDNDDQPQWSEIKSETTDSNENYFKRSTTLTQSQRRRLMPTEDLTSDLNSDTDNFKKKRDSNDNRRDNLQFNFTNTKKPPTQLPKSTTSNNTRQQRSDSDDEIKTPDMDIDFAFQEQALNASKRNNGLSKDPKSSVNNRNGLPDILMQQKRNSISGKSNDKTKKYIEGLEGVPFSEISVPDQLRKQLELYDRDELLQLIAYQKKFIDYKESRIKDLDNYIDNLVVKVIETNPTILMQAGSKLAPRYK